MWLRAKILILYLRVDLEMPTITSSLYLVSSAELKNDQVREGKFIAHSIAPIGSTSWHGVD